MGASSSTGSNTWDKRLVRLALLPAFTCNVIHAGLDDEGGHASRRCFEGKFAGANLGVTHPPHKLSQKWFGRC